MLSHQTTGLRLRKSTWNDIHVTCGWIWCVDNYGDMGRDQYDLNAAASKLKVVSDYAVKAGKLAAFTETGLESIPNLTWWTGTLLKTMRTYDLRLAYVT